MKPSPKTLLPLWILYAKSESFGYVNLNSINPSMIPLSSSEDQQITYTTFNKVESIAQDQNMLDRQLAMEYGVDEQRIKMDISQGGYPMYTISNYYISSANMEILNGVEYTYIYAGGEPIAIHKKTSPTSSEIFYLHLDHQGSLMAISDASGGIVEQRSEVYPAPCGNAWGRPRHPSTWTYLLPNPFGSGSITMRGYTMHEHLDMFSLINMNGRLYDPVLCRMLSPDPFIQSPDNTQNYNRFSYCLNNPLKYTDPSGEIIFTAAVLIAAPFTGGASLALLPYAIGADIGMWQGGTMANGTMNPFKWDYGSGKTWAYMGAGAAIGGVSSFAGAGAGTALTSYTTLTVNHVMYGAITGAVSGAVGGFAMGGLSGVHQNGKWSWNNAWNGAGMGAAGGFVLGGVSTAIGNWIGGRTIWSGNLNSSQIKIPIKSPEANEALKEGSQNNGNISGDETIAEFPGGHKYKNGTLIESPKGAYNGKVVTNQLDIEATVNIPDDFVPVPTTKGDGMIYQNPNIPSQNPQKVLGAVRIMNNDGRVIFYNGKMQPINPNNMQTLNRARLHFYLK